jgi:hypothetical protein
LFLQECYKPLILFSNLLVVLCLILLLSNIPETIIMIKSIYSKLSLFILFFLVCRTNANAQHIDSLLNVLDSKYPQEKIHLQVDKTYYTPGETIWFKAYLTNSTFSPALSTTMYAELLDDKGNILQRKTMPVLEGGAASAFDLTDSIYPAQVYIRAYTAWMLNFDSSLLSLKAVSIVPSKAAAKKQIVPDTYSLTLFPEGGDLVENVQSFVAFKANDQNGKPVDVSGAVMDDAGKKIIAFSSLHDGMGYFPITPLPGEKYKAVWKDKKGAEHTTAFPVAKKEGVVLAINVTGKGIFYTLSRPENVTEEYAAYSVVAQVHQQLVYSAKINMKTKTQVTAPINTDSMPPGIMQVTVFNAAQVPVAERVVFLYGDNSFSFITDLHAVEKNMTRRGHNTLQIDVGGTLRSNLSIAVTDADLNPVSNNEDNIITDLLLSSDLKGYIYNPAYYFSGDDDSLKQHLDLVMMTNGWRRFKWENVLAAKWPQLNYKPESYLSVKGKVFGLSKNQLKGRELTGSLKTKASTSNFFTIPIDENGMFNLSGMYFFDTTKFYYQINNDKDKRLTDVASFTFDNNFVRIPAVAALSLQSMYAVPPPDNTILEKSNLLAALRHTQFEKDKAKTLEIVKVVGKQKTLQEKLDDQMTSGLFKGGDAHIFTTEDDPFAGSAQNVLTYLQGKVAGLQISTVGDGSVTWRGSATSLFLNESNVDIETLQSISMGDVAMIKVFDPPFFGATGGGAGGAIAVYNKKGNSVNTTAIKGLNTATLYGYSPIKEFYSPDYEKLTDPNVSDTRTTLYWNPFILMDEKKRRVKIPFYNSDDCKRIRVVIEGLNELGQLTREEKIFE